MDIKLIGEMYQISFSEAEFLEFKGKKEGVTEYVVGDYKVIHSNALKTFELLVNGEHVFSVADMIRSSSGSMIGRANDVPIVVVIDVI